MITVRSHRSAVRWRAGLSLAGLLVLVGLTSPAMAQRERRTQHPYQGRTGKVRLPDLGQDRPLYQVSDLNRLMEELSFQAEDAPVIELILSSYQDQFREGNSFYQDTISKLEPTQDGIEEIEARKEAARSQLKRIQEEFKLRQADGEWEDRTEMRRALSEATKILQDEIAALERAKLEAVNWGGYFSEYSNAFESWNAQRRELEQNLATELLAFLEPEQRAMWPAVQGRIRIDRALPRSELAGETINLEGMLMARVLDEEARELASGAIQRWQQDVAELLTARSSGFDDVLRSYINSGATESAAAWMAAAQQELLLRATLRDLNLAAVYQVSEALGPEHGPVFQEAVMSRIYPSAFARGRVLRAIDEALAARPPLAEDKAEALGELRQAAAEWMLAFAYRSQPEWQLRDSNRLLTRRSQAGERLFPDGLSMPSAWQAASTVNREELQAWEESMLSSIRDVIGDARYSRLSVTRTAPTRDDGNPGGRGGRGGRPGRGGR